MGVNLLMLDKLIINKKIICFKKILYCFFLRKSLIKTLVSKSYQRQLSCKSLAIAYRKLHQPGQQTYTPSLEHYLMDRFKKKNILILIIQQFGVNCYASKDLHQTRCQMDRINNLPLLQKYFIFFPSNQQHSALVRKKFPLTGPLHWHFLLQHQILLHYVQCVLNWA